MNETKQNRTKEEQKGNKMVLLHASRVEQSRVEQSRVEEFIPTGINTVSYFTDVER